MSTKKIFKKVSGRNVIVEDDGDRVYYNFIIGEKNDTQPLFDAKFQQNLDDVFITNPSEYYISVIRFSIPCQNIPIFIPEIQSFPNTNMNNTAYSVSLEYNGFTSGETFVQFVSGNPNVYVQPISINNRDADTSSIYYWIYNFQDFIDMVNTTLETAFTALNIISGGLPLGSEAPYFEFDPVTQLISLIAQRQFYDAAILNPINIFMNYKLFVYFDALEVLYLGNGSNIYLQNGKDIQFIIKDLKNNWYNPSFLVPVFPPDYFKMTQNFPNLVSWNVFKSLQITSNMIPIREEYSPALKDISGGSNTESQVFLKDFEPILNNGGDSRGILYFVLDGPYQLINLTSTTPLTKLDITVYWIDRFGRKFLLQCPYNQILSMKVVFIKKSSYKEDK